MRLIETLLKTFRRRQKRRVLMFGSAPVSLPPIAEELFENETFRASFMKASDFIYRKRGWSLYDSRASPHPPEGITRPEQYWTQEVVYQACVFQAFNEAGIHFDAVAGISLGEVPAGNAAGVLSFDDLLHVVSEIIPAVLSAKGGDLIAVPASISKVRDAMQEARLQLILDWPAMSVWALPDDWAKVTHRRFRAAGIAYAKLGYNCMSHTRHVDRDALAAGVSHLGHRFFTRPYYSTWKGGLVGDGIEGSYWMHMISEPASITGLWAALRRDDLADIVYIGSIPADKDLFASLPREEQPASFVHAKSLLPAPKPRTANTGGASDIEQTLRSEEFAENPFPFYAKWIAEDKVHYLPGDGVWLVLGYDAILGILKQPGLFSSKPFAGLSPSLFGSDPPDHTHVRRIMTSFITRESLTAQRPQVTAVCREALERVKWMSSFDVPSDLATPVSMGAAAEWLGLNIADAYRFAQRAPGQMVWSEVDPALTDRPGLIREIASSGQLTETEAAEFASFLVIAGVATVRDLLLFVLYSLLRNKDLHAAMRADRTLIPAFVDEVLRSEPPVHGLIRRTTGEVVVEGKRIPQGATVWLMLAAANRDLEKFPRPDEFVLNRSGARHLSFGSGIHYCLGSQLGRLEAEVLLELLLAHGYRLSEIEGPRFEFGGLRESQPGIRGMSSWRLAIGVDDH